MNSRNIIAIFLLTFIISCSQNKNTSSPKTTSAETQTSASGTEKNSSSNPIVAKVDTASVTNEGKAKLQSNDSLMRFIISFYSIGQGIDRGQKEKLISFLEGYEKKSGKKIEYSEVHWGREGETDYCFPMKGFSDTQVTDFIKGAKESLNTAEHVHFLENQVCRKGR